MKIKMAVQKSGRLTDDSMILLRNMGLKFNGSGLKISATNFPLEIFFLRSNDIPEYVESGVVDIGIVGENVVIEKGERVEIFTKLPFGRCRLSFAVEKNNFEFKSIQKLLNHARIATSHPNIVARFLKENRISAERIFQMGGSVEIAPSMGLASVVCDLVDSGKTLKENNLREIKIILESSAVIILSKKNSQKKKKIIKNFLSKITI